MSSLDKHPDLLHLTDGNIQRNNVSKRIFVEYLNTQNHLSWVWNKSIKFLLKLMLE